MERSTRGNLQRSSVHTDIYRKQFRAIGEDAHFYIRRTDGVRRARNFLHVDMPLRHQRAGTGWCWSRGGLGGRGGRAAGCSSARRGNQFVDIQLRGAQLKIHLGMLDVGNTQRALNVGCFREIGHELRVHFPARERHLTRLECDRFAPAFQRQGNSGKL